MNTKKMEWEVLVFKVSTNQSLSNLEANVNYEFNEEYPPLWIPKFE
jgi:hypothetical protein